MEFSPVILSKRVKRFAFMMVKPKMPVLKLDLGSFRIQGKISLKSGTEKFDNQLENLQFTVSPRPHTLYFTSESSEIRIYKE